MRLQLVLRSGVCQYMLGGSAHQVQEPLVRKDLPAFFPHLPVEASALAHERLRYGCFFRGTSFVANGSAADPAVECILMTFELRLGRI